MLAFARALRRLFVAFFVVVAACRAPHPVEPEPVVSPEAAFPEPMQDALRFEWPELDRESTSTKKKRLWATYYSVPTALEIEQGFQLRNMKGTPISPPISRRDWCRAAMEGTIEVRRLDGRTEMFNFRATKGRSQVNCRKYFPRHPKLGKSRFAPARSAFGDGARGTSLVPFRTIATDPRWIRRGSVLYIPAARGVPIELPGGVMRTHDGYFYAGDTGGSIDGPHIDMFLGPRKKNPFAFVKSKSTSRFRAYVLREPGAIGKALARAHGR